MRDLYPAAAAATVPEPSELRTRMIVAVPLTHWEKALSQPPDVLVGMAVADDRGPYLHAAWARAAVLQRDHAWASALLRTITPRTITARTATATGGVTGINWLALVTVLPLGDRYTLLGALIRVGAPADGLAAALLRLLPGPWPDQVASALIGHVEDALAGEHRPGALDHAVLDLAGRRLPITDAFDWARRLESVADDIPRTAGRTAARAAADTLRHRRMFLEELH
jgi:hypothetical protein